MTSEANGRDRVDALPRRIVEGDGPAADALRRFERQPPHVPLEGAAWDRTLARLGRDAGRHPARLAFALVVGAFGGAALLYFASLTRGPVAEPTAAVATTARAGVSSVTVAADAAPVRPRPPPEATPRPPAREGLPRIQLARAAVGLPPGRAELIGEAEILLSPAGRARAFALPGAATVELQAGEVELRVEKRHPDAGRVFEVRSGPYRFTVLGTVFRVSRSNDQVTLSVTEGRVAVNQGKTALAIVAAGGYWVGSARAERPRASWPGGQTQATGGPAPASAVATEARTALAPGQSPTSPPALAMERPGERGAGSQVRPLAREACPARADSGDPRAALACFETAARGSNLGAEVALYEAARLYRDELADPGRAIATLQEARRRFPSGALGAEIGVTLAELLPKVGRYREALDESAALLGGRPGPRRASELHLLRGDVLRAGLGSCAEADAEYEAAARSDDERVADPASFWRAVCFEARGRTADARAAFARYLARGRAARAADARRHLKALEGPDGGRP